MRLPEFAGGDLCRRNTVITELMDDPDCDLVALRRTYGQFRLVNKALAGWRRVYRRWLRPQLDRNRTATLLDIGAGGGDVARALAGWAARDGLRLDITAIDPDPRAYDFATGRPSMSGVSYRAAASGELVAAGARFDFVISNHLLHHLSEVALDALLADSEQLAMRLVVHNDIARSRPAYLAYAVLAWPLGRRSFVHTDGLRSIRRSYRPVELADRVGEGWQVRALVPSRVLLLRAGSAGAFPGVTRSGSIDA